MKLLVLLVATAACGSSTRHGPPAGPELGGAGGPEIELRPLVDGVWLHDSSAVVEPYGRVHANGLVILGSTGAVIVDTAWNPAQTRWLLDQVELATGRPARAVVATHFHGDRAGGASAARAAGVPVYGSSRTRGLVDDQTDITDPFESSASIDLGDRSVRLYFPGAGHSPDNIVVYLPEQKVLFGGCLVRAAESSWIGNLSDADVAAWPATMDRVMARFPDARVVVPGHGAPGGPDLLPHTRRLAREAAAAQRP